MKPLGTWERIIVSGGFGALFLVLLSCAIPFEFVGQVIGWIVTPVAFALSAVFPGLEWNSESHIFLAEGITGAILGAALGAVAPLVRRKKAPVG